MTAPEFTCPRCTHTSRLPSDVSAGYCARCQWWTGDSLLGSEDVLAQARIDGPERLSYLLPRRYDLAAFAAGLTRAAREFGRTMQQVSDTMRSTGSALARWQESFDKIMWTRVTVKRLRRGRVVVRTRTVRKPQPQPWKVAR